MKTCVVCVFFFFFQAEDGIRDLIVTGVQTCALPIFLIVAVLAFALIQSVRSGVINRVTNTVAPLRMQWFPHYDAIHPTGASASTAIRSEERRVGKECRSRGSPYPLKKKKKRKYKRQA